MNKQACALLAALSFNNQAQSAGNPASVDYVNSLIMTIQTQLNKVIGVTPYQVGQQALGGVVFYVDSTGTHGLVAANSAAENVNAGYATGQTWDGGLSNGTSGGDVIVNSTGNGIGAGRMNTSLVVGVQSAYAPSQSVNLSSMAAKVCVNFAVQADGVTPCANPGSAGQACYADWYLPSLYELEQMYLQNSVLNIYPNTSTNDNAFYWSSTEVDENDAWRMNFVTTTNNASAVSKSDLGGAWCIRAF